MKADLASATVAGGAVGGSGKGGKFTREELRQLFSLNINTASDTLDLLPQGKVAGLRWMEPEEVLGDGSPLAMAVASGLVTCLNETKTTAGEAADNRPLSEGLGTQLPADACTGSPSESHEVHSDDNGDAGAPESPSFTEVEGENLCGSDGAVTREEDVHAAGTAMHKDNVDCLDILEDW
ncbi:hypothetical protein Vretimale_15611 [Volvox reticuliferus]|uniref:Uncharacterized protein n=2 Tax=Volvox reticuliferus TaxID=1737510 RepID=A0A8J4LWC3_9CHLO|nr:hypothetical protein Vretimale_15611 [Volvox reticuliferus]